MGTLTHCCRFTYIIANWLLSIQIELQLDSCFQFDSTHFKQWQWLCHFDAFANVMKVFFCDMICFILKKVTVSNRFAIVLIIIDIPIILGIPFDVTIFRIPPKYATAWLLFSEVYPIVARRLIIQIDLNGGRNHYLIAIILWCVNL